MSDTLSKLRQLRQKQNLPEPTRSLKGGFAAPTLFLLITEFTGANAPREDAELVRLAKKIDNDGRYAIKRVAVPTPLGLITDATGIDELKESSDLEYVRKCVEEFNGLLSSQNRKEAPLCLDYYASPLPSEEKLFERLRALAGEQILRLKDALATGDLKAYKTEWYNSQNAWKLVPSKAKAIQDALSIAQVRHQELRQHIAKGSEPETAGKKLDLKILQEVGNSLKK